MILPSSEVWHHLLSLPDISLILQPPASCATEILICLVSVQMSITESLELKHSVAERTAHAKTLLEGLLSFQLVFLYSGILFTDLPHL